MNRQSPEHLGRSRWQFLQSQTVVKELVLADTFWQMRQFLHVKPIATWLLGGASTVNVERRKASNTLTARSEA